MYKKTTLLIDGSNLIYRAFHTTNLKNSKGQKIGGVFGSVKMVLNLLKKFKPDAVIIAWDSGRSPARIAKYPEYKAQRAKNRKPEDVKDIAFNIKITQQVFKHLPVRQISIQDMEVEGDDIIGYLSCKIKGKKIVVSNDQDFIQLVRDDVDVFLPSKVKMITKDNVKEFLGIDVDKYLIWKAMVGDTSDNIKGVNGVGEVTATKIINENRPFDKNWLPIIERNVELMNIGLLMTKEEMNAIVRMYNEELKKPVSSDKVKSIFHVHGFKSLLFKFPQVRYRFGLLRKKEG